MSDNQVENLEVAMQLGSNSQAHAIAETNNGTHSSDNQLENLEIMAPFSESNQVYAIADGGVLSTHCTAVSYESNLQITSSQAAIDTYPTIFVQYADAGQVEVHTMS